MNRAEYDRMRYSGDTNNYHRSSYRERSRKSRPEYIEEEGPEPGYPAGLFSNSQTVLILTVMVGCFGVLWPKIFSPMFFGDNSHHHDLDDHSSFGGGGALFPGEHPNPAMRTRMGAPHPGLAAGQGKQVPGQPPVRTIDKEWPDKHPRPGMRPTLGGPGIQQNQKQAATGGMSVVMPIYTVAILVFFIYTIVKILFKNKDKEEDEDDEDFLNSEYYKNHLAQQKAEQKKKLVTSPAEEGKVKSDESPRELPTSQKETKLEQVKPEKTNVVRFKLEEKTEDESGKEKEKTDDKEEVVEEELKVSPKESSSQNEITPPVADPRDIEIQLLKAKLEQTEKTLEAVLAQMAAISMPNLTRTKKKKSKKSKEILADKEENDTNEE